MTSLPVPVDPDAPLVLTEAVTRLGAGAYKLMGDGSAATTVAAYTRDWARWTDFCAEHGLHALPGHPGAVCMFIAHLVETGAAMNTIERRLAGISYFHRQADLDPPTQHRDVRRTLKGARRTLGVAAKQAAALGPGQMRRLVETMPDTNGGRRDRALVLTGWFGGMRRSEIIGLDIADLEERADGVVATIRRSKTDQEAKGRTVFLPCQPDPTVCPVAALRDWIAELNRQGFTKGPIFRGIGRSSVRILPGRLTSTSIDRIFAQAVARAELTGGPWSPHSLRAGFVTSTAEAGASMIEIASQTGHRANSTVLLGYVRRGDPRRGNAVTRLSL